MKMKENQKKNKEKRKKKEKKKMEKKKEATLGLGRLPLRSAFPALASSQ